MKIRYAAFTERGRALAQKLQTALGGEIRQQGVSVHQWTAENFSAADALVFVGAVGIAVRAVAPFLKSKAQDPAVVVLDERGEFVIPILSGHLGGANDLARKIASVCGACAVITTATDINGVFAADEWARRQGCVVINPEKIRKVSSKLLEGGTIIVQSDWPISGLPPVGVELCERQAADVCLTLQSEKTDALLLVPKILTLGVGCRRGTTRQQLEEMLALFLQETAVRPESILGAASIDLKRDEPGLLEFCACRGWPVQFYTAAQLQKAQGEFTASEFVQHITGVDTVCERSAVVASGGKIYRKKWTKNGVALALAAAPFFPDWRWKA